MWEADALLDAIFDHPDDDTPRLVYADWLQEHGQEHYAEFIRLQCAAAHCKVWSDEANELWVKIGRVWKRLADEWQPAMEEDWWVCPIDACHFNRGFLPATTVLYPNQLHGYRDRPAWFQPPRFRLKTLFDDVSALGSSPLLHRVHSLECGGEWELAYKVDWGLDEDDEDHLPISTDFNPLLRLPELDRLRILDLGGAWLQPSTLDVLLTAPHLASIETIEVSFRWNRDLDHNKAITLLRGRFKEVIPNIASPPPPRPPMPPPARRRRVRPGELPF